MRHINRTPKKLRSISATKKPEGGILLKNVNRIITDGVSKKNYDKWGQIINDLVYMELSGAISGTIGAKIIITYIAVIRNFRFFK